MKVFYIRCSTVQQNEARQIEMAKQIGADKVFIDKTSGKDTNRPEFLKMMSFVREGDVVYCESLSRIARNTKDLLNIVEELTSRKVGFVSLKEQIDDSPRGKFVLTIFAALSELEREFILERQREGIKIAKAEGKYKGRHANKIDEDKFNALCKEWRAGQRTATSIMKSMNLSANSFYRYVERRGL